MKKSKKTIIETDVNSSFSEEITLWNIIGQRNAVEILRTCVDQYQADTIDGRNPKLPSILLIGERGIGKKTLAQAFNNSLGNVISIEVGHSLGLGQDFYECFKEATEHSTLYIDSCENLNRIFQSAIYRVLKEHVLRVPFLFERKMDEIPFENRLIILSSVDTRKIMTTLLDAIDVKIHLGKYSIDELCEILKQRCRVLNWEYENGIMENIAKISNGNAGKAIRILMMGYRVMRSKDEDILKSGHLNRAVHMMDKNGGEGE